MRNRILSMRTGLTDGLAARGVDIDYSFIKRQIGMFSFAGINPDQVDMLRNKHHVYAVHSGRINVAGITSSQMDRLCDALADVLKTK